MVLEALSQVSRMGLSFERLHADDLVLIAEDARTAQEKFIKLREGMYSMGLRVNLDKTKVTISRVGRGNAVMRVCGLVQCVTWGRE